jgi:VWFA-related protein
MQAMAHPEGIIHLDVAATDREGKPFSGLAAKDFTLTDNGVPQRIVSFAASNQATNEDERLTEVVLVLDEVDLSFGQLELVKDESIKFLRQNGGHLGEPTSVYWFTASGLYATASPTTDGNALAEDVAHHNSHRRVWAVSRSYDPFVTAESERYARWDRSLRAVYSIAIERRGAPGRKLLLWMGFGWLAVHGREEYKEAARMLLGSRGCTGRDSISGSQRSVSHEAAAKPLNGVLGNFPRRSLSLPSPKRG